MGRTSVTAAVISSVVIVPAVTSIHAVVIVSVHARTSVSTWNMCKAFNNQRSPGNHESKLDIHLVIYHLLLSPWNQLSLDPLLCHLGKPWPPAAPSLGPFLRRAEGIKKVEINWLHVRRQQVLRRHLNLITANHFVPERNLGALAELLDDVLGIERDESERPSLVLHLVVRQFHQFHLRLEIGKKFIPLGFTEKPQAIANSLRPCRIY